MLFYDQVIKVLLEINILLFVRKHELFDIILGKTIFYKLWLSFDKRAELDLRLTKNIKFEHFTKRLNFFQPPLCARPSYTMSIFLLWNTLQRIELSRAAHKNVPF